MPYSIAARIWLPLALVVCGSAHASAWWDRCECQPYGVYGPAPVYVYDHSKGPTWTSNGWSYPPVGVYYPVPRPHVPYANGCGVYPGFRCAHRSRPSWVWPIW